MGDIGLTHNLQSYMPLDTEVGIALAIVCGSIAGRLSEVGVGGHQVLALNFFTAITFFELN